MMFCNFFVEYYLVFKHYNNVETLLGFLFIPDLINILLGENESQRHTLYTSL